MENSAFFSQIPSPAPTCIYSALGELMNDRVHALSIKALAPGE